MPGNNTKYAYAVGRIRVLETRLLDRIKLDRMVEAPTVQDSLKILGETDYSGSVAAMSSAHDYETMLGDEINRVFGLIRKISPEPELTDVLSLQFDIHNLKVLFKAHYLEESGASSLMQGGTIPPEKLQAMVKEENFRDLPEELQKAAGSIVEEFFITRDPQIIDLYLDKVHFDIMMSTAKRSRSDFLEGFFVKQIDLLNVKTFFRVKRMGRGREFLKKALLPQGRISAELFLGLLDEPVYQLAERLAMTEYAEIISEGVREWQSEGTLTRFEKLSDDYVSIYLMRNRNNPFGLEPLIAYMFAKETEVKNIRMVMVGKINGLPIESIRERLRDVYV